MAVTKSPLPPLEDDEEPVITPVRSEKVDSSGEDEKAFRNQYLATEAALKKQPKTRIRLPEDTRVQINGYGFYIKGKEWVEVPQQVADILEEAGRF